MQLTYVFYALSVLTIFSGLMVVFSKNPVHSVLYLIMCFFTIFGHYVLLNAQFLAAVHLIVYSGAIMVLFLFVIMLLNLNAEAEPHKSNYLKFAATIAAGLLLVTLVGSLKGSASMISGTSPETQIGLVENLGKVLFNEFVLPFEVSSVLFLTAMIGAVMLGKKNVQ
jgi:NADH-quinone oxidoreductase subunit J